MEFRLLRAHGVHKEPRLGRLRCFHCLLSPDGDDPIFAGINRLVAKGLAVDEQTKGTDAIQYPCQGTLDKGYPINILLQQERPVCVKIWRSCEK
jgi:hypothetical protein